MVFVFFINKLSNYWVVLLLITLSKNCIDILLSTFLRMRLTNSVTPPKTFYWDTLLIITTICFVTLLMERYNNFFPTTLHLLFLSSHLIHFKYEVPHFLPTIFYFVWPGCFLIYKAVYCSTGFFLSYVTFWYIDFPKVAGILLLSNTMKYSLHYLTFFPAPVIMDPSVFLITFRLVGLNYWCFSIILKKCL